MSIVLSESTVCKPAASIEAAGEISEKNKPDQAMYRFCGTIEAITADLDAPAFAIVSESVIALIRELQSLRFAGRKVSTLGFKVCERNFPVRIAAPGEIVRDDEGADAWAITDPVVGEIVISSECPRCEWLHTLMHEFHRVWAMYHYESENQTAAAMNFARECGEFNRQFTAQGGLATLLALKPRLG